MNETLHIGNLLFEIRRSSRRKTLGLTVDRGGELVLHAPVVSPVDELERWARKKLLWVHRKLALKETVTRLREPEFVRGESFSYLGRRYGLKIVREQHEPLRFDGRNFLLRHDARNNASEHFRRWYIHTGRNWLIERLPALSRRTVTMPTRVEVRDLGFRWGSCGKNGVLYFNWRLLQLPVRLVDYVAVHEMVHLKSRQHNTEFWQLVERALPEWGERKEQLEKMSDEFLVFRKPYRARKDTLADSWKE